MNLMMVSLDLEKLKADGYTMPNCFIQICNVEADTEIEALKKFRLKTGFLLSGEYVKIAKV